MPGPDMANRFHATLLASAQFAGELFPFIEVDFEVGAEGLEGRNVRVQRFRHGGLIRIQDVAPQIPGTHGEPGHIEKARPGYGGSIGRAIVQR